MSDKYAFGALPIEKIGEQMERRIVTGDRLMIARVELRSGFVVGHHSHRNEQMTYVLRGRLRFWIDNAAGCAERERDVDVSAGEVLVVDGNVGHRALALSDTVLLDIFTPPRDDWLDGTDDYLRTSAGQ